MATLSTQRAPKHRQVATLLFVLVAITWVIGGVRGQKNETGRGDFFLRELVAKYGDGGSMNATQVAMLVTAVQKMAPDQGQGQGHGQGHSVQDGTDVGGLTGKLCGNLSSEQCLRTKVSEVMVSFVTTCILYTQ